MGTLKKGLKAFDAMMRWPDKTDKVIGYMMYLGGGTMIAVFTVIFFYLYFTKSFVPSP